MRFAGQANSFSGTYCLFRQPMVIVIAQRGMPLLLSFRLVSTALERVTLSLQQ